MINLENLPTITLSFSLNRKWRKGIAVNKHEAIRICDVTTPRMLQSLLRHPHSKLGHAIKGQRRHYSHITENQKTQSFPEVVNNLPPDNKGRIGLIKLVKRN